MGTNTRNYGDNVNILRRYIGGGSVGLVYLDPPSNAEADGNVLFVNEAI